MVQDPEALEKQTDRYLRALGGAGIISNELRESALAERSGLRTLHRDEGQTSFVSNKAPDAVRAALLPRLGLKDTYSLDRLDLTVNTTFDERAQQSITRFMEHLSDPEQVQRANLGQHQLLSQGDTHPVVYSFLLYERGPGANLLRVETDNLNQPLDINRGTKLELGSTAKLRTLAGR